MRRLWGRQTSINVQKVVWVLSETNLPYDRIDAGGAFGGLKAADYQAMNPHGRVPTLQEGDFVMWESNAICRYLVDARGGPLAGGTAEARGQASMWMDWFQNGPYVPFIKMFYQTVRLPERERNPQTLKRALEQLRDYFAIAEASLADRDYLLGDQLSLADIPFGACLYRYFTLEIDRPNFPRIAGYYDRLRAREAYQKSVMISYDSLRPAK